MLGTKMITKLQKLRTWAKYLKTEIVALYYAYRDPRVPLGAKVFTALVVAYALSPVDLIPDFIPVLGYLDDLIILPWCISIAIRMIPPDVLNDSREKAKLLTRRPENRIAGVIIIFLWIAIILATAQLFFNAF